MKPSARINQCRIPGLQHTIGILEARLQCDQCITVQVTCGEWAREGDEEKTHKEKALHGFGDGSHIVPITDKETNRRRYEWGRGCMCIIVYVGEPRAWLEMTFLDQRIDREVKRYLILIQVTFNFMYSYVVNVFGVKEGLLWNLNYISKGLIREMY